MQKSIVLGIEDFKEIKKDSCYYVDKTLFIKELCDNRGKVSLFTRPRRFGKTLALSMLKTFFEAETDVYGRLTDNRHYFDGLEIIQAGEEYTMHMGQYPVISLSLKSAKQPDYKMSYQSLLDEIAGEYERHRYVLQGETLLKANRDRFIRIMERRADSVEYAKSLAFLSDCLKQYHNKKTIILIDEYDIPLENAYLLGFYGEMITFIRSLFESAMKTSDSLEFAVITGCLRISKESIFTGLNNLEINTVLNVNYSDYFGFTEHEVCQILEDYGISAKYDVVKKWYNGYLFGKTEVYNPWSVLNYVKAALSDKNAFPKPYWSNTSSNSIVREMVEQADNVMKKEIEELIAGGTVKKPVHEDITYEDIHKTQDNLWNFLFFTGYLRLIGQCLEVDTIYLTMRIPNEEVRYIFRNTIREWFEQRTKQTNFHLFYQDILEGKCEKMSDFIIHQLSGSISYYDNAENFYHGYMVGILSGLEGYEIDSNKEHGEGRPDIVLKPFNPKKPVIILELKRAEKLAQMEKMCQDALRQIDDMEYAAEFLEEGYQKILKYGVCFCKKSCVIRMSPNS